MSRPGLRRMKNRPSTLTVARSVGWVSFMEIVRDKILYNAVLCAILLLGVSYLASQLSFTRQSRIILDFGLSAINISCTLIAILIGAVMVSREFERRTVFVALSKPITRFEFLLGKFAGLVSVIFVNWLILMVVYLGIYLGMGGQLHFTLIWANILILLQCCILGVMAIFFSSFSTTSLSVIITFGFYLVGNNISQIRFMAGKAESALVQWILEALAAVLPNMEHFNLGLKVTYGLPVALSSAALAVVYAGVLMVLFLFLSGFVIHKREI